LRTSRFRVKYGDLPDKSGRALAYRR
jgi:hypothetical protein